MRKQKRIPILDRLWPKIDKRGPDECWPWTAATTFGGYGVLGAGGKRGLIVRAHRLVYQTMIGPLDSTDEVLHTCDNPPCCNPVHLRKGSHADNMADAHEKMRMSHGERHHQCKLSDKQVTDIRNAVAAGAIKNRLAQQYGVNRSYISMLTLPRYQDRRRRIS